MQTALDAVRRVPSDAPLRLGLTGAVARGDAATLARHMAALAGHDPAAALKAFSDKLDAAMAGGARLPAGEDLAVQLVQLAHERLERGAREALAFAKQTLVQLQAHEPSVHALWKRVVEAWVGLPVGAVEWSIVKEADLVMLATEKRDLLAPSVVPWGPLPPPDAGEIVPWDWLRAEEAFREEFERLYVDRGPVALAHFHHCPGCCQSMPCRERCTIEGELSENGVETGAHIACSPACEKVIAERDAEHERGAAQADGTRASP